MTSAATVDIAEVMGRRGIGPVRSLAVSLCALVALLDGFDLQIIGLAAPAIAAALHIPVAGLGAVFAAALAGLAVGGIGFAPLADRVGRKPVLVAAVVCFGLFTLATMTAESVPALLVYRFATGLGLGTAVPCAVSLASEFVPARRRATTAGLLFAGFPFGGVLAGLLGSRLLSTTGWHGLFLVGGVAPLVLAVLMVLLLPESPIFLVARGAPVARIARVLAKVAPDLRVDAGTRFVGVQPRTGRAPVSRLFESGRRGSTLLLWAASFVAFGVLVVNSSWTPTLLAPLGLPVARTALALAVFNAGSVLATAAGGWLLTRFGARRVLPVAFAVAAVGVAGIGVAAPSLAGVAALQVLIGLGLGCASSGVIGLAAVAYPTAIRSTGVGWALGIGRVGSFSGPLLVAALVAAAWAVPGVFGLLGALCLVGGVAAAALRPMRAEADPVATPAVAEGAS
ncbi:MAG TPA: MFS transporter [Pseudonocardia sp.]|uniref:MFS transporter n=1 Tax=Pseudonocardia sp. TaxID=60912 RepID=UPI002BD86400|nr:MFS transporter [Pseudonocardia sp.]HTF52821.1 MFS transporter [Pseudonocardia sp.]